MPYAEVADVVEDIVEAYLALRTKPDNNAKVVQAAPDGYTLVMGADSPIAIALYRSSGYTAIPGFGYYKDSPHNRCFAKPLGPDAH